MKDYKICVYGICKNESKFVDRFMDALEEIKDHVYILDTGSTDNTVELFKKRGAHISTKKYEKFNFDEARNDSLDLVPKDYDICICLDIDDVIEPGFVEKIKNVWQDDTSQIRYKYYYTIDDSGVPIVQFFNNHIHARFSYVWKYPIHEVLHFIGEKETILTVPEIIIRHYPDNTKSRKFYFDLLEESVIKYKDDTRCIFLLAREYLNSGLYEKCIKQCHDYLKIPSATYKPERCKLMIFLAKSYRHLKYYEECLLWSDKALEEVSNTREPYIEKLISYYEMKEFNNAIKYGKEALKIKDYNFDMIEDAACFDGTIEDYISLAYFYLEDYDNAIKYINKDIKKNPYIERLKENKRIFENAKAKKEKEKKDN